ncbi:MAG: helix-turn-helix domain-containing protein [Desulfamplus sp.]|nr:helix-turn-helix domain-containing protein [Desulfamplus sp.]
METEKNILYGWKDIAGYIGCSQATAKKYQKKYHLPVRKINSRILISKTMVEEWLEKYGCSVVERNKSL